MTVSVRCSPEQHEQWRKAAEAEKRTMNNAMKVAMDEWVEKVLSAHRAKQTGDGR